MAFTTLYRADFIMPYLTNTAEDVAINTWYFAGDGGTIPDDVAYITTRVEGFYTFGDGSDAPCNYLSALINTEACRIKVYNLLDDKPRAPLPGGDVVVTLPDTSGSALPQDVCAIVNMTHAPVSGENRARNRRHIKFGPLGNPAESDSGLNVSFVSEPCRDSLVGAVAWMNERVAGDPIFVGFSPTTAGAEPWTQADLEGAVFVLNKARVNRRFGTRRARDTLAVGQDNFSNV